MSRDFRFKQFSIRQSNAPMKVGTDGVLLGAWVSINCVENALDIGTGTGLIALMLAQRSAQAEIDALEPNQDALIDAKQNIAKSSWSDRINLIEGSWPKWPFNKKYDLIVSNPPFFHGDLSAPDEGRNMARHAGAFDYRSFLNAGKFLTPEGILAGIYPTSIFEALTKELGEMSISRCTYIKPTPNKPANRVLFELSRKTQGKAEVDELIIEAFGRHQYSPEYINLTKDFYLKH